MNANFHTTHTQVDSIKRFNLFVSPILQIQAFQITQNLGKILYNILRLSQQHSAVCMREKLQ